jgi:hypothetical protein
MLRHMIAVNQQQSQTLILLTCARCAALLLALCLLMLSPRLSAHGSVVDGGDGCTIQFDFYSAHFAIFQPRTRQHREYCEDIPDVTESVFVMEYLHNSLREVPVDFRIIRNETQLGRFVKWSDLEVIGDLSPLTVFHQYFPPQPDGVLRVIHDFQEAGSYIGIVTVPHPSDAQLIYHAVFPFRVGRSLTDYWPWLLPVLPLGVLLYRKRNKRKPRGYTV